MTTEVSTLADSDTSVEIIEAPVRRGGRRGKAETEYRRRQVYEMRMAGLTIQQVADSLGVHYNTVANDMWQDLS